MAAYIDLGISITAVNNATRPLRQAGDDVKKVGENAQATANRLKAIQVVIAGILINKTLELGRAFSDMAAQNQALDLRMTAFAGTAQKASAIQEELSKKFAASGLVVDDLAQNFIEVRNAVQSNEQGVRLVEAMANAVLSIGGGQKDVDNLAQSFQRLGGRGSVTMRDLNSILQNTPITLADIAKAAGQTSTAFEGQLRNGFVNSQKFIEAFIKASNDKVGDWSKGLSSTIGGSFKYIGNAIDDAVGDLGKRTDLNARMATLFTNIGNAIKTFIGNIDQSKVDHFFGFLSDMEPVVTRLVVAIAKIAVVVASLADVIFKFLDGLPQAAFDYGVIGYVLLGRKGAILGALLGSIDQKIRDIGKSTDQFMVDHGIAPEFFANDKKKLDKSTLDALMEAMGANTASNSATGGIFGSKKQIDDMKKAIDDMFAKVGQVGGTKGDISYMMQEALEKAKALHDEIVDLIDQTKGRIDLLNFNTAGDSLGAQIQGIKNETQGWVDQLQKALLKIQQSNVPIAGAKQLEADINDQIKRANEARDAAIAKAQKMYEIQQATLKLQQESTRNGLLQQGQSLDRDTNNNPLFNVMRGTAGGQIVEGIQDQLYQMNGQVLDYQTKILELKKQQAETVDPMMIDNLQKTIDLYGVMVDKTEAAMKGLDANGQATKQLWQDIGSGVFDSLSSGLTGLINHTKSFGDVMNDVMNSITQSAVNFLLKLVEIYIQQQLISGLSSSAGAAGGAGGGDLIGTLFSFLGGFANGGAFKGQITPFANGGLVQGPTLFGLAGEAGDEAIMPLTRIGGKLGVRSAGGGGNHYHITVQAIDTQSGLDFIAQNLDAIDTGLHHRKVLGRAMRQS